MICLWRAPRLLFSDSPARGSVSSSRGAGSLFPVNLPYLPAFAFQSEGDGVRIEGLAT